MRAARADPRASAHQMCEISTGLDVIRPAGDKQLGEDEDRYAAVSPAFL